MPLIIIGSSLFIHPFMLAFTHWSSSTSASPFSSLWLHNLGLTPQPISSPKSLHTAVIISDTHFLMTPLLLYYQTWLDSWDSDVFRQPTCLLRMASNNLSVLCFPLLSLSHMHPHHFSHPSALVLVELLYTTLPHLLTANHLSYLINPFSSKDQREMTADTLTLLQHSCFTPVQVWPQCTHTPYTSPLYLYSHKLASIGHHNIIWGKWITVMVKQKYFNWCLRSHK